MSNPLKNLFTRPVAPMAGIYLSGTMIRLVELGKDAGGAWILERIAQEGLPAGAIVDDEIVQLDVVVGVLKRLVTKSGCKAKLFVTALPKSKAYTRKIVLDAGLSDRDMEDQAAAEASNALPFSVDDAALDFFVVGPLPGADDRLDAVLVAAKQSDVEDVQAVLEGARLKVAVIESESNASTLGLSLCFRGEGLHAVFEMGARGTRFRVLRGNQPLMGSDRDFQLGGNQLTALVSQHYGLTPAEAEARKCSGDLPEEFREVILPEYVKTLATEMIQALNTFFATSPFTTVDDIVLSGGSANVVGLSDEIASLTGTPCYVANPFVDMQMGAGVRAGFARKEGAAFVKVAGLAMRRFVK